MTTLTDILPRIERGPSRLAALSSLVGDYLARSRQRARLIRELELQTDRELADMGIARADIRAIARGQFTR